MLTKPTGLFRLTGDGAYDNKLVVKVDSDPLEDQKAFRKGMSRVYQMMRSGNVPPSELLKEMRSALNVSGRDETSAKASLRAKMLLNTNRMGGKNNAEKLRLDLQETIGRDAYDRIVFHDRLLQEWIDFL